MLIERVVADLDILDKLPTLPTVLARLLDTIRRSDAGLDEVVATVQEDPVLAVRVLRVANSPVYGGRAPARTIRDALFRLGLLEVREMALALSASAALPIRGSRLGYEHFWRHSLSVARTAETVARRAALPAGAAPGSAFLGGLFHDLGLLIFANHYAMFFDEVVAHARRARLPLAKAEQEVVLTDHGELGAVVVERWGLDDSVASAIRGHHRLDRVPAEHRWRAAVVQVADALCAEVGLGDLSTPLPTLIEDAASQTLGLSAETLGELAAAAVVEVRRAASILAAA